MFRKLLTAVTAFVVLGALVATPAYAKDVKPRRGEGIYSMTLRTCGSAASWRQQAAHNGITARSGYLVIYGRTYDIDCPGTSANSPKPAPKPSAKGWVHPLPNGKRAVGKPYVRGLCWHAPRYENGRFSHYHEGVDLSARSGTAIRAVHSGRIIRAGWRGGYGYAVEVRHSNGTTTLYAHASRIVRWKGTVKKGETIARVGSTGHSFGPHLHIEVKVNGKKVNPSTYLRARGVKVGC